MKQKDVASSIDASLGLIGIWASGRAKPSYEKIGKLIEMGISAQELFGTELGDELVRNSRNVDAKSAEFKAGVKEALTEILGLDAKA